MTKIRYELVESKDDRRNKVYYTQFIVGPWVFGPEYEEVRKLDTHGQMLVRHLDDVLWRPTPMAMAQKIWTILAESDCLSDYPLDSIGVTLWTNYPSWPKPGDEAKTYVHVRMCVPKPSLRWRDVDIQTHLDWQGVGSAIKDYYAKGLAELELDKETEKVRQMASHTCEWMVSEVRDEARKRVRFDSRLAGLVAEAQAEAKAILKETDFRKKLREEPWECGTVDPPVVTKLAEAGVDSYFSRWSPLVGGQRGYPRLGSDPTQVTTEEAQSALKELTQEAS